MFSLELVSAKGCRIQGAVVVGLLRLHLMVGQVGSQLHGLFCSAHLAHLAEAETDAVLVMEAELAWVKVIE